ncbi:MAG TPA: MBL fold metallo-hydrolase, partial [Burkholderiaceae bacterium]|nr:MBL fold metallo-hydrolase [Burkholderiaceae bacterium]
MNPDYDASKAHHTRAGFRNTAPTRSRTTGDFVRWQRERSQRDIPAPKIDLSVVAPDLAFVQGNRKQFAVTYIGHATTLVQLGGVNVLTDPHFSPRAFPVQFVGPQRWQPPGVALRDLPHIDVVLVSHNHYDHLDTASIVALNKQAAGPPLFLVPLGIDRWMQKVGVKNFKALDWWQQDTVNDMTIT